MDFPHFLIDVPLPISGEIDALAALHCQRRYAAYLIAIRDAAVTRQSFSLGAQVTGRFTNEP